MTLESFENILSLICTIVGLLYCVFRYIETPKRGFRLLIGYFLAKFLSEYYWTIYVIVMHTYPDVSGFTAYLGWNVGYLCLFLAMLCMRREGAKRFFHPVMLLPIPVTIPQLLLYNRYGGLLNNLWEVGITTLTMILCLQSLAFHLKSRESRRRFPWLSLLVLVCLITSYGMWTSSCFEWENELLCPYFYCSVIGSLISVFLAYGAKKHYGSEGLRAASNGVSELRFQVIIQSVMCLLIVGICAAGYYIASQIQNEGQIVTTLFAVSTVLILLILGLLYVLTSRYRSILEINEKADAGMHGRRNLIITIAVTLALMIIAGVYNSTTLYNASVVSVYEDGVKEIKSTATELENYLTVAATTLRVVADGVDYMVNDGRSSEDLAQFIVGDRRRSSHSSSSIRRSGRPNSLMKTLRAFTPTSTANTWTVSAGCRRRDTNRQRETGIPRR